MSRKIMIRRLLPVAILTAWGFGLLSTRTTAGFPMKVPCLNQTGCGICCPVCDHVCKLEAEQVQADVPCFDVESKVICIPRVVFPWQKKKLHSCDACDGVGCTNCVHNGARVRRICVLKTDKIQCPKCEYTWSTEKKCDGCDGGCDACFPATCDETITPAWQAESQTDSSHETAEPASLPPVSVQAVRAFFGGRD